MKEIDDELQALYRAARPHEAPTGADRLAVRASVLSVLGSSAVATTASAAVTQTTIAGAVGGPVAQAFALGKLALWLGAGAAIGSAVSSAAWVLSPAPALLPSAPIAARAPASVAKVSGQRPLPAPRSLSVAAEPAPPPESGRADGKRALVLEPPRAARDVTANPPATAPAEASSLLAESEGLLSIQRALATGDAARALTLSREQHARFRGGALSEERAALQVLALCAAGELEQARSARARFAVDYPRSPHAKRLLNSCAK
jgi:hypothetical protein